MENLKQLINRDIVNLLCFGNLNDKERAVIGILSGRWGDRHVTQREIGEHRYWKEAMKTSNSESENIDTITRDVRRVIRELRVTHKLPILHSSSGHYLPESQEELEEFITRLELEAKGRAASSIETYKVMKQTLGVGSNYLEQLDFVGTQLIKQV